MRGAARLGRYHWAASIAAVLVCGGALPSASQAVFPGRNGVIAYTYNDRDRSGQSAIVTVRASGRGRRVIHKSIIGDDTGYGAFGAAWSPGGSELAFADYADPDPGGQGIEQIFVSNANGSGLRQLTPNALTVGAWSPSWAPDGNQVAFIAGAGDITTIHADGTHMIQLTHDGASDPNWLKTGRIAFQRGGGIYTMAADGTGVLRVPLGDASLPSWSPLGRNLVFVRRHHVYIARSDGSRVRVLTSGSELDSSPAFSPDGLWIVFTRRPRSVPDPGPQPNLWLVDIHGHHAHRILREPAGPGGGLTAGAYDPAWQPLP